jgi:DNA-binding response OmpR family regulator
MKHILIVDDDAEIRQALETGFHKDGWTVAGGRRGDRSAGAVPRQPGTGGDYGYAARSRMNC